MDAIDRWLRESDPSLAWQVERDLLDEPEEVWRATRRRVASEGFGARLLALQDADGQWAGGAFFPAGFFDDEEARAEPGQPWTATTWSLNALREWGVDASALDGTAERLAASSRWEYDGSPYWGGEVDCCINASTLSNGLWLGADVEGLATWFVEHRQADGGWNCEWVEGSTRSSFHSTLNVLRALLDHEEATGGTAATRAARRAGEEYLLERRLLRGLRTGEPLGEWTTRLASPQRWRFDVLRATEYFRRATIHDGGDPDPRLAEAVEAVRAARHPDGTWHQGLRDPGRVWFEVDVPPGEPSPWLTFSARRVLRWTDAAPALPR
ncbi:hypothetical protein AS850_06185 [Frondihabitans sp. 762G35]|uniref:squalene cyclase n=1 Tax=Frondihabitans sp. 762G35 TaxID=1446794 RepID=UPI000D22BC27|nr:squalene cyclase [Frondihabitans sp. 762G35]ARC56661.1 hypothetical protein AS850_06185 [Frondihabitans sp. 762G35]